MFAFHAERPDDLRWEVREIVRELDHRPHLLTRVEVTGRPFPIVDRPPFMRLIDGESTARAWFVDVVEDGSAVRGYFAVGTEVRGTLEFGVGNDIVGRVDIEGRSEIPHLDRERLPRNLVVVTPDFLAERLGG